MNDDAHHHRYQYHDPDHHLIRAGFRTPFGSFCAQVLITEVAILSVQRISAGQDRFFEEFLCTFQTAVLSKELEIIWKAYGTLAYAAGMFCLGVLYSLTFRKGVHTNPVSTIHLFSTHDRLTEVAELVVHVSVQTFAAVVAEKYVFALWSSRFFNSGLAVVHMENPCESDLQVPVIVGILVEGLATFILRLMSHAPHGGIDEVMLCSLAGVICSLAASPFTGGYANPSMAFTAQFSCNGHENWEFAIVYVAGPVIAAYFVGQYGDRIWRWLRPNRHRSLPGPEIHSASGHHVAHHPEAHHHHYRSVPRHGMHSFSRND